MHAPVSPANRKQGIATCPDVIFEEQCCGDGCRVERVWQNSGQVRETGGPTAHHRLHPCGRPGVEGCRLRGQQLLPHADGVSLLPVMSGTGHIPARPLVFHFPHYTHATGSNSVLTEDNWKLIRFYNNSAGRFLLYDLAADPHELKDRSAEQPDRVRAMDARLSGLLKEMHVHFPVHNPNCVHSPHPPSKGSKTDEQHDDAIGGRARLPLELASGSMRIHPQ